MPDTSARLLKLLSLLQTPRDWAGAELAERLGVSSRTVRRDIERLRELGYPVHATRGTAGYRLGAGAAVPPLLLDDDEAVAVAVGLRTAAVSQGWRKHRRGRSRSWSRSCRRGCGTGCRPCRAP